MTSPVRWVQRFTPERIDAARPSRHQVRYRWFVDDDLRQGLRSMAVRLPGNSPARPGHRRIRVQAQGYRFGAPVLHHDPCRAPLTRGAPAKANVVDELTPAAFRNTGQYAYENNRCMCDHGRLKARLRPMRGLKTDRTASVAIRGQAFIQNLQRGHYELGVEVPLMFQLATGFDEL